MEDFDKRFIRRCAKVQKCIELKGNICVDCRKNLFNTPWNAEFHHIDPKTKENSISQLMDEHFSKIVKELKKCILLCCECHRKHHFNVDRYKKYKKIIKERISEIDLYNNKKIDEDKVYSLIKQRKTIIDIALILNTKERSVRRVLRKLEKDKKEKLIPTKEEYLSSRRKITDQELIKCLSKNMKRKEIREKFDICYSGLSKRISRLKSQGVTK